MTSIFSPTKNRIMGLSQIESIDAVGNSSLAISKDGKLYYWGKCTKDELICPFKGDDLPSTPTSNFDGVSIFQPREVPFEINLGVGETKVVDVSCSKGTCIVVVKKGSTTISYCAWGDNSKKQITQKNVNTATPVCLSFYNSFVFTQAILIHETTKLRFASIFFRNIQFTANFLI